MITSRKEQAYTSCLRETIRMWNYVFSQGVKSTTKTTPNKKRGEPKPIIWYKRRKPQTECTQNSIFAGLIKVRNKPVQLKHPFYSVYCNKINKGNFKKKSKDLASFLTDDLQKCVQIRDKHLSEGMTLRATYVAMENNTWVLNFTNGPWTEKSLWNFFRSGTPPR